VTAWPAESFLANALCLRQAICAHIELHEGISILCLSCARLGLSCVSPYQTRLQGEQVLFCASVTEAYLLFCRGCKWGCVPHPAQTSVTRRHKQRQHCICAHGQVLVGHQLLCNQWVLCGASSQLSVCLSFDHEFVHHESTNQSNHQTVKPSISQTINHSLKQASKQGGKASEAFS